MPDNVGNVPYVASDFTLSLRSFSLVFVAFNIAILSLFVLFMITGSKLREKGTSRGRTSGVYIAFIVALFMEMYGLNLCLFIFTWAFGYDFVDNWYNFIAIPLGKDLWYAIFFDAILPVSNMMIMIGMALVIIGWSQIYKAKGQLVTTGIYKYIRHPQYLGFMLITIGMIVLWPVTTTLILWPFLFLLYRRLAKQEEKSMEEKFGEEYLRYKSSVPKFLPRL